MLMLVLTLGATSAGASPETGRSVILVTIGSFSEPSVQVVARHLRQKFRVRVTRRASLGFPSGSYDGSRKQYAGEKLLAQLEQAYGRGVVIAVTDRDIYMASRAYRFVFSIRDQRAAVVSSARMDPRFTDFLPTRSSGIRASARWRARW